MITHINTYALGLTVAVEAIVNANVAMNLKMSDSPMAQQF